MTETIDSLRVERQVRSELYDALEAFDRMHSPHEGIAVIEEEYLELRAHVYGNTGRSSEARAEAIQLAAMAMRYAIELTAMT